MWVLSRLCGNCIQGENWSDAYFAAKVQSFAGLFHRPSELACILWLNPGVVRLGVLSRCAVLLGG